MQPIYPSPPYKPKLFPFRPRSPWLRSLMQRCWFILAVNWVSQGMRGMQAKELSFRLLLETLFVAVAMGPFLGLGFSMPELLCLAIVAAHTASFLVNGQIWVCARYCAAYRRDPAALDRFIATTVVELRASPWLETAVCIGSRSAVGGTLGSRSDIDLRLIFPEGWGNWLRVNLLLLTLRTRALFAVVPLDLYAYDTLQALDRFDRHEPLLVILDRTGCLARRYVARHHIAA